MSSYSSAKGKGRLHPQRSIWWINHPEIGHRDLERDAWMDTDEFSSGVAGDGGRGTRLVKSIST